MLIFAGIGESERCALRAVVCWLRKRSALLRGHFNKERRWRAGYAGTDRPVCAASEASRHFLDGAASPPNLGGDLGKPNSNNQAVPEESRTPKIKRALRKAELQKSSGSQSPP